MKEFMMIFRTENVERPEPSPEEMQAVYNVWQDWIGGIAAQGKFIATNALGREGSLIQADGTQTDGPYAEVKEIVGGYLICNAESLEDAIGLAKGCPMFDIGGTVEVRDIMVFDVPEK